MMLGGSDPGLLSREAAEVVLSHSMAQCYITKTKYCSDDDDDDDDDDGKKQRSENGENKQKRCSSKRLFIYLVLLSSGSSPERTRHVCICQARFRGWQNGLPS